LVASVARCRDRDRHESASCAGAATTFWDKTLGTLTALTATNCEWTQFDLGWKGRGYSWEAPDALALPEPADCASSNAKSFLLA
jgi:hypothetical protein